MSREELDRRLNIFAFNLKSHHPFGRMYLEGLLLGTFNAHVTQCMFNNKGSMFIINSLELQGNLIHYEQTTNNVYIILNLQYLG